MRNDTVMGRGTALSVGAAMNRSGGMRACGTGSTARVRQSCIIIRLALLVALFLYLPQVCAQWRLAGEHESGTGNAALRVVTKTIAGERALSLHLVLPEPHQTHLIVLDNPDNAHWLDESLAARDCLAGTNGGFYHPDTTPIGLVVSEGRKIHGFERARLLSGVLVVRGGAPLLLRVAEFSPEMTFSEGLQAGPFVLEHGEPVGGLDATKRARRTVIMTGGDGRYALAVADEPLTLAELASLLASPGIVHELRIDRALNLDGGSSSSLWARMAETALYLPEGKRPRNFLCIMGDPGH
jgi:hypothetical protein